MAKKSELKAQIQQIETETTELETYWKPRNNQMLSDRSIINLDKPKATTASIKWISNEPKVFYETAVSVLSSYSPRFRLPLSINFKPEEKDKMNKAERFTLGIFRSLDERQKQNFWLREFIYKLLSGWYSVFVLVRRNGDSVDFIADIWDSITVYPEWDADELVKCVRSFEVDKRTARSMVTNWQSRGVPVEYIEPGDEKARVKVINYWKKEKESVFNSLIVGDNLVKPLTLEKRFNHIPIFVGAIGIPDQTSDDWVTRFGENIIAPIRDMNEYENQIASLEATILAETAYPNIISKTVTGAPAIKEGQMQGYGTVVPIKIPETIELLKHAATPQEAAILHAWVTRQRQKGSFSDAVYGGMPNFEISGFALSQFLASIRYRIGSYWIVAQKVVGRIASEFLEQYKNGDEKGKFSKISLSTTNPNEIRKGLFFVEEFKPSDVPESSYVECTIPITTAVDKVQQMLFARQALQPPLLLSRETLWDEMLDIQDSEQEYTRIIQDQTLELPIVKTIAMIEQLRQRIVFYENQNKLAEAQALRKYIEMLEMQVGMKPPPVTQPPGIPPNVAPPEMGITAPSPDVLRSAMGVPPPGLERRPQTPEERAESQRGV